jgi:hypothetical protein
MPFYVRGAGDEGDIVEIEDLDFCQPQTLADGIKTLTFRWRSNFGFERD